jgi:hypothetical protein
VNILTVLEHLGLDEHREAIAADWDASVSSRPDGPIAFLAPSFVEEACRYVGVGREVTSQMVAAAGRIAGDECLSALTWHGHRQLYHTGADISLWPGLEASLGDHAEAFYFLALLSGCPEMRRVHRARGVEAEVVAETVADVRWHVEANHRMKGRYGVSARLADWLRLHFEGRLYSLGRLQFVHETFGDEVAAYRRDGGAVTALAGEAMELRRDGLRNGGSGITETEGTWTPGLRITESQAIGHPIDPATGVVAREPVTLELSEWRPVLQAGDAVLDIHIPEAGPLTPQACAESIRRALEFFPRHFPDQPAARALVCDAWLFDPELRDYLGEDSNIIRFQRQFYLYPGVCDSWEAFRHVFPIEIPDGHQGPMDLSALPRETSLQRALLEHVESGRRWRNAGGFVLVDDLPWGRQPYRPT